MGVCLSVCVSVSVSVCVCVCVCVSVSLSVCVCVLANTGEQTSSQAWLQLGAHADTPDRGGSNEQHVKVALDLWCPGVERAGESVGVGG